MKLAKAIPSITLVDGNVLRALSAEFTESIPVFSWDKWEEIKKVAERFGDAPPVKNVGVTIHARASTGFPKDAVVSTLEFLRKQFPADETGAGSPRKRSP